MLGVVSNAVSRGAEVNREVVVIRFVRHAVPAHCASPLRGEIDSSIRPLPLKLGIPIFSFANQFNANVAIICSIYADIWKMFAAREEDGAAWLSVRQKGLERSRTSAWQPLNVANRNGRIYTLLHGESLKGAYGI